MHAHIYTHMHTGEEKINIKGKIKLKSGDQPEK